MSHATFTNAYGRKKYDTSHCKSFPTWYSILCGFKSQHSACSLPLRTICWSVCGNSLQRNTMNWLQTLWLTTLLLNIVNIVMGKLQCNVWSSIMPWNQLSVGGNWLAAIIKYFSLIWGRLNELADSNVQLLLCQSDPWQVFTLNWQLWYR